MSVINTTAAINNKLRPFRLYPCKKCPAPGKINDEISTKNLRMVLIVTQIVEALRECHFSPLHTGRRDTNHIEPPLSL